MPTDFAVAINVRQQFGDSSARIEPDAPLVGPTKDFDFPTPNVDANAPAVLMFQTRGVNHPRNILQINGQGVFGGIPVTPSHAEWNGNIMLISPGVLRGTGQNTMHIESRNAAGGGGGNLDDFMIDNAVVLYKTR